MSRARLAGWTALVGVVAAANYAARFGGKASKDSLYGSLDPAIAGFFVNHGHSIPAVYRTSAASTDIVYKYSTFVGGIVLYAIWLGFVLLIAIDRFDLLALRPPRRWGRGLGLAAGAVVLIYVWEAVVSVLPLPQSPGQEQGLTPSHWEPQHAGAFAANLVLFTLVAPFVEELTFRGVGQSLLRFLGRWPSIVLVGVAFGLAHGLVEALLVLVPFGAALAYVRDRTDSIVPGMLVHGLFNGVALAVAVLSG